MYGCESWTVKKAKCQRIDAFEMWWWTLASPLECKEIQPVHSKGDQSCVFFGKTDAGRDLGQEEKGTTEDEMAGWHH